MWQAAVYGVADEGPGGTSARRRGAPRDRVATCRTSPRFDHVSGDRLSMCRPPSPSGDLPLDQRGQTRDNSGWPPRTGMTHRGGGAFAESPALRHRTTRLSCFGKHRELWDATGGTPPLLRDQTGPDVGWPCCCADLPALPDDCTTRGAGAPAPSRCGPAARRQRSLTMLRATRVRRRWCGAPMLTGAPEVEVRGFRWSPTEARATGHEAGLRQRLYRAVCST